MRVEDLPLIDRPVPHAERVERLVAGFREQFGRAPEGIAEAPGRVNLIGEHIDYNDGLVLPFAIDRTVMCAWARDARGRIAFHSTGDREYIDFAPRVRWAAEQYCWHDYPVGVLSELTDANHEVEGLRSLFSGDVPRGAGLSSSAAIEVATAGAFRDAFSLRISDAQLALLCQRAENEYVGVQCGIMDQFASALSKRGHALLIDCRTLDYRHIPLRLAGHGLAVVIANSAVERQLAASAYNDRRRECEQAVARLRELLGRPELSSLRDVYPLEIVTIRIDDDDWVMRRARHVVGEIARVHSAALALAEDDFVELGELMVESHLSLKTDYDVSSEQLDLLVGLATAQDYVLGARLTGAGFGGCTVNLVRADRIEDFARDVIAPYRERTGLPAVMYVTEAWDGLRTWRL